MTHSMWIHLNTLYHCTFRVGHSCILFNSNIRIHNQPINHKYIRNIWQYVCFEKSQYHANKFSCNAKETDAEVNLVLSNM